MGNSRFSWRWPLMVLVMMALWFLPLAADADCLLRVGWDYWPPYITYSDGVFHGLEYDLLKETASAAGCGIKMVHVPWARALRMLRNGDLDLLYGADYSPERAKFARFSVSYRQEAFVLVTKGAATPKVRSVSLSAWIQTHEAGSSPHRILGLFRGDFYGERIDRVLKHNARDLTLLYLGSNQQMVQMLKLGRLDGFIIEEGVASMELKAAGFPVQYRVIREQEQDPLYYMFSRKVSDAVVARFNAAIRQRKSMPGKQ